MAQQSTRRQIAELLRVLGDEYETAAKEAKELRDDTKAEHLHRRAADFWQVSAILAMEDEGKIASILAAIAAADSGRA